MEDRGDVVDVLTALGLSDAEAEVYLTMLRKGPGTASKLATRAGLGRRHTYDVVNALTEQGLASYVDKENKRVYKPVQPERLRELVQEEREELNELDERVAAVLPQLVAQFEADTAEREVRVLEGKDGIKQLFNDQLRQADDTIHLIGSPVEAEEVLEYFLPSWTERRQEQGVKIKGVFEDQMRGQVGDHPPIETRFLPEGHASKVSISVYGETVGIIFWIDDPLVIMIEDAQAARSFMSYFHLVWAGAEP